MIKVTVGGQDVALDLSRTLAQSGIRPGSTLKLKLTGLLGGMPTGHPEPAARAPAQSAAPATATPLDADAGPSEHLDCAARALVRAEGLALGLAGDLAYIFALAPSGSDPGDHDLRKDLAADAAASDASSPPDHRAMEARLALESEAVLRRERDSLLDWKVGLELGLPELGGPAQVVRGFRGLHEVERKSASLDARVLELEQQLALARADIEREQRATAAEKEMVASFKAEEILLRDAKVLELQQELQTTKAHILKSLLYSDFTDF
jgi:hypothetical protein